MNEAAVIDPPDAFAGTAVPLLKEYTSKLQDWFQQLETALPIARSSPEGVTSNSCRAAQARIDSLVEVWNRFRPPAYDFARQISGMIEQGAISPLEKVELRLRLAEFEGALIGFEQFVNKRSKK